MIGKIFIGIIAIFLLLGAFASPILDGIKEWRTDGLTTEQEVVVTGAGITSANVTLDRDLYQASITQVDDISSTDESDTPVATAYVEDDKVLTIDGLNDDSSRTLTIQYYGETESSLMRVLGPFLGVFIIGGLIFMVIWGIFKKY